MPETMIVGSPEDRKHREDAIDTAISEAKRAVMKPCFTVEQGIALRMAFDALSDAIKRAI